MNILGIGPLEFLLILIIMLVVLGPKDMVATGRKIGRFIRNVIRSPYWSTIMETSKEIRDIPAKLVREAGIEEDIAQLKKDTQESLQQIQDDMQTTAQEIHQDMQVTMETVALPSMDEVHKIASSDAVISPNGAVPFTAEAIAEAPAGSLVEAPAEAPAEAPIGAPAEAPQVAIEPSQKVEPPVSEPSVENVKDEPTTPEKPGIVTEPGNGRVADDLVAFDPDPVAEISEPSQPPAPLKLLPDAPPDSDPETSSSDFTI